MNLDEVPHHRRSIRVYDKEKPVGTEKVKHCLELVISAPNSSDMQLWEFYHITELESLTKISRDCLGQKAASTISQIVIFVVRCDWYKKRARLVLNPERENIRHYSSKERQAKRIKDREIYYGILMPFVYTRLSGILGLLRKLLANIISVFRPTMLEVLESDIRATAHKLCVFAAQTFTIAMANKGYDTCPLEGLDSRRLKRILRLSHGAETSMAIPCGIRDGNKDIWGERCRVSFENVYHEL